MCISRAMQLIAQCCQKTSLFLVANWCLIHSRNNLFLNKSVRMSTISIAIICANEFSKRIFMLFINLPICVWEILQILQVFNEDKPTLYR